MSSSCNPRKYHGAFDGFGVWFGSASASNGAFAIAEKIVTSAVSDRSDANSIDEQVRPRVDLVLRFAARLLDRAGLDDRQQSLRVPTGTRSRRCGRDRSRRGPTGRGTRGTTAGGGRCGGAGVAVAAARERGLALARPLEQVRGHAADVLGDRVAGVGRGRGFRRRFLDVVGGRVGGFGGRGGFAFVTLDRSGRAPCGALGSA